MTSAVPSSTARRFLLRAGLTVLAAIAVVTAIADDPARAATPVSVFPSPGSRVATEKTQITFRGVPIAQLGHITVKGHLSGTHSGRLRADSDGQGGSFIPNRPFAAAERVSVTASGVSIRGGKGGSYSFITARPGLTLIPNHLPGARRVPGDIMQFKSRPDLTPASVKILTRTAGIGTDDVFIGTQGGPITNGAMMLDPSGRLIFYRGAPKDQQVNDFRVQTLAGKPVLTWWQGKFALGVGLGSDYVYDTRYRRVATIHAGNGLAADLHEFQLTDHGTALITAYQPVMWDARSAHASSQQDTLDCVVQEIDIKTGLVLFEWHSLDHVSVSDSYGNRPTAASQPYDYFHINSIQQDTDGNLVVSGRDVSAGYKIDHATAKTIWTLGGKHSSFKIPTADQFAWQHDIRMRSASTVSLFDDGAGDQATHKASRMEVMSLDFTHHTAHAVASFGHTPSVLSFFEGNAQLLPNGSYFVGWGQNGYFTQFDAQGHVQFDMTFVDKNGSYRGYRFPWSAHPANLPAVAVTKASGKDTVYASWNGATGIAAWRFLSGSSASHLSTATTTKYRNFETSATIPAAAYVAAEPLDSQGNALSRPKVMKVK